MERLNTLNNQLSHANNDNDVVICYAKRTPLTKSKKGALKDTSCEMLLFHLLKDVQSVVQPNKVEDIVIGNVLQTGSGVAQVRMASLMAGFPETTCSLAIDRLCSSGLEAVNIVASKIFNNTISIGIAGGVEQMSQYEMMNMIDTEKISEAVFDHPQARNCMMGMGETSENVAEAFKITREKQDWLAVESHRKALQAQEKGYFNDEIVKFTTKVMDKDGKEQMVQVSQDDGMRKGLNMEILGKLKPAFRKNGTTTAGNASQVTDGASIVLLARRSVAKELKLPILAKFRAYAVSGVAPDIMGIGPAFAIPKVLEKAGLKQSDINIFEINEAFASQATYCVEKLGIDWAKVNPKGGAIALGHPLGCTGARQIATLLPELRRQKGKYGVVSMCIGTGMGAAAVIELEN